MSKDIHRKIYFHTLSWIGFSLIIIFSADELDRVFVLKSLSNIVPAIILFYSLILWVFPSYLGKHINLKTALITGSIAIATVFLRPLFIQLFANDLYFPFDRIAFWVQFRYNILFVGIAFAYHYASEIIKSEHSKSLLEKENSDAKLALLKNQINPHFLHNTLSMVYTKALPLSEDLAQMIAQLSSLLRYSIAETDVEGKVSLHDEIKYVQQYIALNEARFNKIDHCNVQIIGITSEYRIAPMLLISFIENAYKHGLMDKPISVTLHVKNTELYFCVENHIGKGTKDKSSGIGLQNVKSRLELLYPNQHLLTIEKQDEIYKASLKLW